MPETHSHTHAAHTQASCLGGCKETKEHEGRKKKMQDQTLELGDTNTAVVPCMNNSIILLTEKLKITLTL